ncbi:MAG: translation initiation factor IF-6 [Thermoplasmata archaeon]
MLVKHSVESQPYIGIFSVTSEELTVVPRTDSAPFSKAMETSIVNTTIGGTRLIGALSVLNSKGMLVADIIDERELDPILEYVEVTSLPEKHNALGNNMLVNDNGALINPNLSKESEEAVAQGLGVEVKRGTIAGLKMVGSLGVATNRGVLCHPHIKDHEIELMKDVFKVPVSKTTANHGSGWIGTCMVANTKGAVIGDVTTPIEMGRIEDGLGYLE